VIKIIKNFLSNVKPSMLLGLNREIYRVLSASSGRHVHHVEVEQNGGFCAQAMTESTVPPTKRFVLDCVPGRNRPSIFVAAPPLPWYFGEMRVLPRPVMQASRSLRNRTAKTIGCALLGAVGLLAFAGKSQAASTICQVQATGNSYCSDQAAGPADGGGYHNLAWINLNKNLASISVSDNQVWGIDSSHVLWYLPNFKTSTNWIKVASGVAKISAAHNLLCQINNNQHVYCSGSPTPPSAGDSNGYHSINWTDTGASNFDQIAVSAGTQFWGVDTSGNLIQVKDYKAVAATSTAVAAGVQQVAVDGRGLVCQVNNDQFVYCSNWASPAAIANPEPYHGLPWFKSNAQLKNITVADGQVWGVDSSGKAWQLPDYTNAPGWFRIANIGVGAQVSGASTPSGFAPSSFGSNDVAVLMFMGQSNSAGINPQPTRFIAPASPNVWGIENAGWNFLPGNKNGTAPFSGAISTIQSVSWINWAISATGADMNLGFNNVSGAAGNAANFAAFQWQQLVNAGWKLPDLYIVHIGWPSQGVDVQDVERGSAAWITHGVNLWQPGLDTSKLPSYALAPFARTIMYRGLKSILASGKTPRVLNLQWNQWEAEANNAHPITVTNAPNNYKNLVNGFNAALGTRFPIQFVKPLSAAYGASTLTQMQKVFADLVATDTANLSVIDVSQVLTSIYSGGILGGGDGSVHYNLDTHGWFASKAMAPCLISGNCGTRITSLPGAAPN